VLNLKARNRWISYGILKKNVKENHYLSKISIFLST